MNITEYIKSVGVPVIAKQIGVTERAVQSWKLRQRKPRPEDAMKLVELSGGMISFSSIYRKK